MRRHGSDGRRAASQAIAGEVRDWSKKLGIGQKIGAGQKKKYWTVWPKDSKIGNFTMVPGGIHEEELDRGRTTAWCLPMMMMMMTMMKMTMMMMMMRMVDKIEPIHSKSNQHVIGGGKAEGLHELENTGIS